LNDEIESQKINKKIKEKIQNQKNKDWNEKNTKNYNWRTKLKKNFCKMNKNEIRDQKNEDWN